MISAAAGGSDGEMRLFGWLGSPVEKNGYPYITLTETCVLPVSYADDNIPQGGLPR